LKVTIGFEVGTGARVEMRLNHTVITGITGSGKTTLTKRIIQQVDKAIVFDIKNDYVDLYPDVLTYPPNVSSKLVDPLMLKEILEVYSGMSLRGEFPELIKLSQESKSIFQLSRNLQNLLESSRIHPLRRDKLLVINEILKNFIDEIRPILIMKRSSEKPKIRIDLSPLGNSIQQFVVAEEIRWLKKGYKVFIDEAHRFVPQSNSSISRRPIVNLLREGRSRDNFVFLIDQTITGILKDALKQCWNWILGKQMEFNELKRVTKQIIGISIKPEDVASLRVGEFLYFTPGEIFRFYAWPLFKSQKEAEEIAIEMGEIPGIKKNEQALKRTPKQGMKQNRDLLNELINALGKIVSVISTLIESNENNLGSGSLRESIIKLISNNPGLTLNELLSMLVDSGYPKVDVSRVIKDLIDNEIIVIKPDNSEVRFYLSDSIENKIDDIDIT